MTRAEYLAPANQRRTKIQEMRSSGICAQEIARQLAISIREVYRLLQSLTVNTVTSTRASSSPLVQGSPGLSDFEGPLLKKTPLRRSARASRMK